MAQETCTFFCLWLRKPVLFFPFGSGFLSRFYYKNHQKIFCSSGNLCCFLTFGSGFLSCLCFVDSGFLSHQIQIVFLSKTSVEIGSGNLSQFLHSCTFFLSQKANPSPIFSSLCNSFIQNQKVFF